MARTDVAMVSVGAGSNASRASQSNRPVWTAASTWYYVYVDNSADVYYQKTTNAGVTWGPPVAVHTAGTSGAIAVWFDKWTPGDSGTVIHIAGFEVSGNHDVYYVALDTNGDSLGTEVVVFNGVSGVGGANSCISVTKSKGNRILVGFDIDGGTELGFAKSDDFPVTAFTAKTDFQEATSDYYILMPGNYADANDIDCYYWDRSADEITIKTYDDSANNWTGVSAETSIAGTMVDMTTATVAPQFAAASRNSDGHHILVAWSAADTANADLRCWDINGASSITEKTNVVLNSTDDQAACGIAIDIAASDALYVFYLGKSDGSETAYTSLNVYYKVSTDGGTNWGAETKLTQSARIVSNLSVCPEHNTAAEFVVTWGGVETATTVSQHTSALPAGGSNRVYGS